MRNLKLLLSGSNECRMMTPHALTTSGLVSHSGFLFYNFFVFFWSEHGVDVDKEIVSNVLRRGSLSTDGETNPISFR